MALWWVWLVVGLAVVACVAVGLPLLSHGMRQARQNGATTAVGSAFDMLDGVFNPGRFREMEGRRHEAEKQWRQEDGAPPISRIDLDRRRATIHLPPPNRADNQQT